ncbi:hypothetical protein HQN90_03070 [Paenibacillus alba]|nr:hypothetical protein [Paenibacillus alba]
MKQIQATQANTTNSSHPTMKVCINRKTGTTCWPTVFQTTCKNASKTTAQVWMEAFFDSNLKIWDSRFWTIL